jgi:hypothetical protein
VAFQVRAKEIIMKGMTGSMTFDELDRFLVDDLGLVTDSGERGAGKTYFFQRVAWLPAETTQVVRVLPGARGEVMAVKLCVSSDNNNSVLIKPPFERDVLRERVNVEIAMLTSTHRVDMTADVGSPLFCRSP